MSSLLICFEFLQLTVEASALDVDSDTLNNYISQHLSISYAPPYA